jgi:hypothetical protein
VNGERVERRRSQAVLKFCFLHSLEGLRKIMNSYAIFVLDFHYQSVKINSRSLFCLDTFLCVVSRCVSYLVILLWVAGSQMGCL